MKKIILSVITSLITLSYSSGQGTVRGKVTDENGETLIGVTIVLKSNKSIGTITDLDGNYSLKINDATPQTLVVSFISYKTIEEPVHPVNGAVTIKNFVMASAAHAIKEVVVTAKAVKAKEYYTETIKKNSATTLDYVSSETMKRTGDVNVTSAVTRVAGVSSTSNGFITVRGIGDRYIKSSINGSRIPTLDPFTNNIKLDIFPASLVDNVFITKTASPDLPGDWAGAYLSVETKDYPENLSINVETSFGYNSQSTFNDVLSSRRSSTDWLGYDHSFREHGHTDFSDAVLYPNQFQQLAAIGLGSYYSSMGVTGWTENDPVGDTYYKLGLVKLGLLAPALFNDPIAFSNAKNLYQSGNYSEQAFNIINAPAAKTGQSFADNWTTTTRKAPLDFSQSFSIGNQITFLGKPLGFIGGFRYSSSTQYDPASLAERPYSGDGPLRIESLKTQQVGKETNGWSALFNVAYKFNPNNSVSLLFMPNLTGVNNARISYETIDPATVETQFYEQRKQLVYQYKSEHYLPGPKIKMEFNGSYTMGNSSAPDFKVLQYQGGGNNFFIDPLNKPADRYYRYLTDNLFDSRMSLEMPIGNKTGLTRKIKIGGSYQHDKQKNDQYNYHLNPGNLPASNVTSIDNLLSLDNFGISDNSMVWYYTEDLLPVNHTFGRSSIEAGFVMIDYAVIPALRLTGGLRVEHATVYTDVDLYDSLGYVPNDIRRYYKAGYPVANPGNLDERNYLPSVNLIYKLRNDELSPVNIRLNYSETVARPSIRELSDVSVFDYELQSYVTGNSDLKMVHIKNYDLRLETYFKNGDNVSLSLFYKDFRNHIELETSNTFYWQNVEKSNASGIELEGKKSITRHLEFRANLTFVNSTTTFVRTRTEAAGGIKVVYYEDTVKRPMFGQAPYILNGILTYTADSLGLTLTASYNVQGARLVVGSNNATVPDIYELPRNLLDFKIVKSINKHFSASVTVRDIFDTSVRRSFKYPEGYIVDYDKYKWGTSYVFGIQYKL